jgi:hypothetical protein
MRTNPKLLLVACAALIVLGFAVFTLREPPGEAPSSLPGYAKADAPASTPVPTSAPSPHSESTAQADYFPLSDTYQRNYLVEVSYLGAAPTFGLAKIAVDGRESIRGHEYYKVLLRVTGIPEMRDPVLRYCRTEDDAWRELDGDRKSDPAFETVALPLPSRVGAIWDKDTPAERSNWKIEGTETVVLFGKSYANCLRVSYERHLKQEPDYFETGHYFLAPDVGLIQQVVMVAGSRITFTLDHRAPEAIAFYTRWAGTYEGFRERQRTGGQIQLFADGRYKMIRSTSDSAVDGGQYEPNPGREGEMLLLDDHGITIVCSYRRKQLGPDHAVLYLKCITPIDLPGEEYVRDAPSPGG